MNTSGKFIHWIKWYAGKSKGLLARIAIVALHRPRIFVKLAIIIGTTWMKGQVIVRSVDNRITTSMNQVEC